MNEGAHIRHIVMNETTDELFVNIQNRIWKLSISQEKIGVREVWTTIGVLITISFLLLYGALV